jgi:CheY-like chemotaxis protein
VLEPDQGAGACFTLHLPIAAETPTEPEPSEDRPSAVPNGHPRHILVVDDEPAVREALVAQLGRMGCRVDSASNITEAHRNILKNDYDALLLDVRMPGGTGLELHDRLKKERPILIRRIVFMTGDFANEDVVRDIRNRGNPLLEKPFTLHELAQTLQGNVGAHVPAPFNGRGVTIGSN